jgi:probable metal-binding protein
MPDFGNKMDKQIAAGKVLQQITESFQNEEFTSNQLKALLDKVFNCSSNEMKFVNCSGREFNYVELLDFFVTKGKLLKKEEKKYTFNPDFVCNCKH